MTGVIRSKLQCQLIRSAFEALKVGGVLVYSTCTLNVQENEHVFGSPVRFLGVEGTQSEVVGPAKTCATTTEETCRSCAEGIPGGGFLSHRGAPKSSNLLGFSMK